MCSLCGNRGVIDTRSVRTAAALLVGRLNYCFCPNGQHMRAAGTPLEPPTTGRSREDWKALVRKYHPKAQFTVETGKGETYGPPGSITAHVGLDMQADVVGIFTPEYSWANPREL
jgi:hypothetical protein